MNTQFYTDSNVMDVQQITNILGFHRGGVTTTAFTGCSWSPASAPQQYLGFTGLTPDVRKPYVSPCRLTPQRQHVISCTAALYRADAEAVNAVRVGLRETERVERLIILAETALAWQTPPTYRRWFSCWRGRGVGVNDLLNMT